MNDHPRAMLAYARLAQISHAKKQLQGRDRFLVLAGAAACRSGCLDVAERCRTLILANNRSHMIGRFGSFAQAMRDEDFLTFLQRRARLCSYERAEHLLAELNLNEPVDDELTPVGQRALDILSDM